MRKRIRYQKRKIIPDLKYHSATVAQIITKVMIGGKKETAERAVYRAFDIIREKTKKEPLEIFEQALKNAGPLLEVRSRRIGGASYQIPHEVSGDRRTALAMRWIIQAARARAGKPIEEFLAEELLAAYNNSGEAVKKKDNMHRMAEANRAFAHFARI